MKNEIKLFEQRKVRTHWDEERQKWFFSITDVIEILTGSPRPRKYWSALKTKLQQEGSELSHNLGHLKMEAEDGKLRLSLSYDIVKANGGELKVETKEDEGSTFIIQLPMYQT